VKSSIKSDMTLLCLAVIIAVSLPVHGKEKNKNNNGQPPQTQPENGNNSRIQALEAEDARLQQLIKDIGPSSGTKGDTGATGRYWNRA
jgi:hypothetical protein